MLTSGLTHAIAKNLEVVQRFDNYLAFLISATTPRFWTVDGVGRVQIAVRIQQKGHISPRLREVGSLRDPCERLFGGRASGRRQWRQLSDRYGVGGRLENGEELHGQRFNGRVGLRIVLHDCSKQRFVAPEGSEGAREELVSVAPRVPARSRPERIGHHDEAG